MDNYNSTNLKNKKLLLVTHKLELEGAPLSLFYLARGLKSLGYNITILAPYDGPVHQKYQDEKIKVEIKPIFWDEPNLAVKFFEGFDLVYLNTIEGYIFIEPVKKTKSRIIWCIREIGKKYRRKEIKDKFFEMADVVVFNSHATKKYYSDLNHKNNFVTIHNGVDIESIERFVSENNKKTLREKYGFLENDTIITIIGTVNRKKGQHIFAKAAVKLLKSFNSNLNFLIVGAREKKSSSRITRIKNTENKLKKIKRVFANPKRLSNLILNYDPLFKYRKEIEKIITKNNCSSKILLIAPTHDVFDYYMISDIFVCASNIEPFGRIITEAMAFKVPIITTNVDGIPEQIENNKSGILIPPDDPDLLADKIKFLLNNPKVSQQYVSNAFDRAKKEFPIEKMINSYDSLINKILN